MLQADHHQLRLGFVNEYLIRYDADNSWPLCILWTGEAHFSFTGNDSSENCVHWTDSEITVTSTRYESMLTDYVFPDLLLSGVVWMKDNAVLLVESSVKFLLPEHFGDRIISSHFMFSRPLRSTDPLSEVLAVEIPEIQGVLINTAN
ncbi:hypothetical protein AVEN_6484-1 [Araneus ventricosus]|uniref:Uncharacterized protein n=1 Tax=Araneus ventricosus TaxID=182803 RepID=A0A4Y2HAV5_ARAVE|nr:hypothetical protein AVEN_6484-1 [Araneus ventricosus]